MQRSSSHGVRARNSVGSISLYAAFAMVAVAILLLGGSGFRFGAEQGEASCPPLTDEYDRQRENDLMEMKYEEQLMRLSEKLVETEAQLAVAKRAENDATEEAAKCAIDEAVKLAGAQAEFSSSAIGGASDTELDPNSERSPGQSLARDVGLIGSKGIVPQHPFIVLMILIVIHQCWRWLVRRPKPEEGVGVGKENTNLGSAEGEKHDVVWG